MSASFLLGGMTAVVVTMAQRRVLMKADDAPKGRNGKWMLDVEKQEAQGVAQTSATREGL